MTWGDLASSGLTWGDLASSGLTWGDLLKLNLEEVKAFVGAARPALATLSDSELSDLRAGLRDGSLRPDKVEAAPVEAAGALSVVRAIWTKVGPKTRGDTVAYLSLLVAVVTAVQGSAPHEEQPLEVHVEVVVPPAPPSPKQSSSPSPSPSLTPEPQTDR